MSSHEFVQRGRELLERGDYQEAVKVCRRGLLSRPTAVEGRLLLGRALMALRRYGEVVTEMGVVLDADARHPQALAMKGEALLRKGDAGRAVQVLKQAHEGVPANPSVNALLRQAEKAAAKSNFDFSDDPNDSVTRHYPLPLQEEAPAKAAGPLPPASPGARSGARPGARPGARSTSTTQSESGSMEIYLEPGDAELIDDLLDAPLGSDSGSLAPPQSAKGDEATDPAAAALTRKMRSLDDRRAGSPRPARALSNEPTIATPEPVSEPAEEIFDELVEEARSQPSVTGVLDALDMGGDTDGGAASPEDDPLPFRASSFDEPTVIYRQSEPRIGGASALDDSATEGVTSVATDHYPLLPVPAKGAAQAGTGGSANAPSELPGDVLAGLEDEASALDDEPPTQMIPLTTGWSGAGGDEAAETESFPASPEPEAPLPIAPPPIALPPIAVSPAPSSASPVASPMAMPPVRPVATPPGARPSVIPASAPLAAPAPATPAGQGPVLAGNLQAPFASTEGSAAAPLPGSASGARAPAPHEPPPRRKRTIYYVMAALVVIAGGVIAGFQIRKVRLDWQINEAREQAAKQAELDTYASYERARRAYMDILAVDEEPRTMAALARVQAALAAELGVGLDAARTAVAAVAGNEQLDAVVARAYLALAEGDAAAAVEHARTVSSLAPDSGFGPYLTGRAKLLAGVGTDAVADFDSALAREQRPLFHVGLGRAYLLQASAQTRAAGEALDSAEAAFRGALERVPNHPAAVLGLADVALARAGEVPARLPADLERLVDEAARPLAEQSLGVSPVQAVRAVLALGALRRLQGDEDGAREAVTRARAMLESDAELGAFLALDLARALAGLGDIEAAMAEARRAVEAYPGRMEARTMLASLALAVGDPETALQVLDQVGGQAGGETGDQTNHQINEMISRNAVALTLRARARMARGELAPATDDLDRALALDSALPDALVARAEVELRQGDAEAAAERLAPLLEGEEGAGARPGVSADAHVVYATALRRVGRLEEARQVIQALVEGPEAGRAYLELARLERRQGNFDQARKSYASAAERLDGVDAPLEAALLEFDTGARRGGKDMIAALAERAGDKGRVLIEAARIHALAGALDQAEEYLERAQAIESVPRWQIAREQGRLALRRKQLDAAIESLSRARDLQERDPEIYLLLIEAHLAVPDSQAAARVRDQVEARFDDTMPVRHLAMGRLASISTKPEQAVQAYRKARALLEKQDALPRELAYVDYLLARVYYFMDNLREAESVLSKLLRRDPEYADAHFVLGLVEYTREQPERAIEAFEKTIALDLASHPDALFYLGEVNYQMDHRAQAEKAFRAYLTQVPDGEHAREATAYLQELK